MTSDGLTLITESAVPFRPTMLLEPHVKTGAGYFNSLAVFATSAFNMVYRKAVEVIIFTTKTLKTVVGKHFKFKLLSATAGIFAYFLAVGLAVTFGLHVVLSIALPASCCSVVGLSVSTGRTETQLFPSLVPSGFLFLMKRIVLSPITTIAGLAHSFSPERFAAFTFFLVFWSSHVRIISSK
jgi:hypothetical protein